MSISDNYTPLKQIGNNVTTQFTTLWKPLSASFLRVFLENIATGVQTLQIEGTHYTVSFNSNGTAIVTFLVAPSSANNVIVSRVITKDQTDPYRTSKGFQGGVVENSFDKLTAICQDIFENVGRALKFKVGSPATQYVLDDPVNGRALKWDTINLKVVSSAFDPDTLGTAAASAAASAAAASAAAAQASASAVAITSTLRQSGVVCATSGTANSIILSNPLGITELLDFDTFVFEAIADNTSPIVVATITGATPINVPIINNDGVSINIGDIETGGKYSVTYNALPTPSFVLINPDNIDLTNTNKISGTLGIGNGGTGAQSAAAARTNLDVIQPLGCSMVQQSAQSIPNNTATAIIFGAASEEWDDGSFHDTSVNTSRITPAFVGRGIFNVRVGLSTALAAGYYIYIYKNGANFQQQNFTPTANGAGQLVFMTDIILFNSTDYFEVFVAQVTGGAVNTVPAQTKFQFHRVR